MKSSSSLKTNDQTGTSNTEILNLTSIDKNYGNVEALKKLNLRVLKGEIVSILGPSGAGKTTTLKVIAGLEKADKGKIIFNSIEVAMVRCSRSIKYART